MSNHNRRDILCSVRGGPESRATVQRAIELALESAAGLTFFHIVDAEFLGQSTPIPAPLSVVYQELVETGKFLMEILADRARRQGVNEVDYVVREGNIRKQLQRMAIESGAEILVLGQPIHGSSRNVFNPAEFQNFVATLEQKGITTTVVQINSQSISRD